MLNDKNFKYIRERLDYHIETKSKLPSAAAIQDLVEKCIKEKDYKDYNNDSEISIYDVIVIFSAHEQDYLFGVYNTDNNGEKILQYSTREGIKAVYLI